MTARGTQPLAVVGTGMVTAVGLDAPSTCAAIRAGATNPTETRFMISSGEWLMSHKVPMGESDMRRKLGRMAAAAIEEALASVAVEGRNNVPLILCVAESARPGRLDGLDSRLLREIEELLGLASHRESTVIPHGRVSLGMALLEARRILYGNVAPLVVIVATDSLLHWPTLREFEKEDRLLTPDNSNGFIPGEAGAAVLLSRPTGQLQLLVEGVGLAVEQAHIVSDVPLKAQGLTRAIHLALAEARCEMHDLDLRITDISGEHYYFKEASLALSRTLKRRKEQFDIWHPAECVGETGSVIGPIILGVAEAACKKAYSGGRHILCHIANDDGERAAVVVHYAET